MSFGWEFTEEFVRFLVGFLTLKIFAALRHRRSCGGGKKASRVLSHSPGYSSQGKLYCGEINFGAVQHQSSDTDAEVMASTSKTSSELVGNPREWANDRPIDP